MLIGKRQGTSRRHYQAERNTTLFRKTTSGGRFIWSLTLLAALAACGGDQGEAGAGAAAEAAREIYREGMDELDYGDLDPADVGLHVTWATNLISYDPRPDTETARLTDVTISSHEGFDRVTFSFEPRIPGYRLQFSEEAGGGCDGTEAGTGAPAQLAVEFARAAASDGGTPLITELDRTPGYPSLSRAVQTCDEEDTVRWLLGTSGDAEYRLMEAFAYTLLVVDLRVRPAAGEVSPEGRGAEPGNPN